MATPLALTLEQLLADLKRSAKTLPHSKNSDPDAQRRKAEARHAGLHVDPRPATEEWNANIPWTPTALVVRTHIQHCRCCDATSETLIGYFVKSTAPHHRTRWERVTSPMPGLPDELETTEEDISECPLCIRLDHALRDVQPRRQLPLDLC